MLKVPEARKKGSPNTGQPENHLLIVILTPKVRKTLDISVRICIATLSVSYIIYRIYTLRAGEASAYFSSVLERNNVLTVSLLLFFLMIINWGIESYKWRMLIRQTESVSFLRSFQAVLGGLAVSVFTPNRVGEFFGRAFILEKTDPLKAIVLTLVGSFSQLLVTIVFGTLAYLFFAPRYLQIIPYDMAGKRYLLYNGDIVIDIAVYLLQYFGSKPYINFIACQVFG
jgi:hypothetical protein